MGVLLPDFPDVTWSYGAQERKGLKPVLLVITFALSTLCSELCDCALSVGYYVNVHLLHCATVHTLQRTVEMCTVCSVQCVHCRKMQLP